MTLLNEADAVYLGDLAADAVHVGDVLVWSALLKSAAVWIDASQDSFTDGASISSYTEHSKNRRVLSASSAPKFRADIGGKPRLEFDGAAGMKSAADYQPPTTGITFVMVNRVIAPSEYGMMLVYNSGGNGYELRYESTNMRVQIVGDYTMGGPVFSSSLTETVGVDYLHWVEFNATTRQTRVWINGTQRGSGSCLATITRPLSNLWIGRRAEGYFLKSYVSEALVFDGPVASADRVAIETYLRAKWAIPWTVAITLPSPDTPPSEKPPLMPETDSL